MDIQITVSRTVQVQQFEPLMISITENHKVEDRKEETKKTLALAKLINKMVQDAVDELRE